MEKDKITISQLLQDSDKAEMVEWLKEHCESATKILIICGKPNDKGNLDLSATHIGFQYVYELEGFMEIAADFIDDCGSDNGDDD